VVLRYYADFDQARIAEILDCSPGTVRSQIHRALAKLRVDPSLQAIAEGS
jgi:RNA polymerase sigma factor (sigma-70 family)